MNGDRLFLLAIILVVIYLTVVPIAVMIFGSVQSGLPGTWTPLTFANYVRAFSHLALYSAIFYSLVYSTGAGLISFRYRNLACLAYRADRHTLRQVVQFVL